MSCTEYRRLIQERFDQELEPDDTGSLEEHIERCDSCGKFDHQLDQMILGAEEVPLPEDLTPPNPEALAKMVQQQLPQQKGSILQAFFGLFEGLTNKAKGKGAGSAGAGGPKKGRGESRQEQEARESAFPHRSKKPRSKEMEEDESSVSARLKSIRNKSEMIDDRDAQSSTGSLGQRLGFSAGDSLTEGGAGGTPLTLAESIRRKISETATPDDMFDESMEDPVAMGGGAGAWGDYPGGQPNTLPGPGGSMPPGLPNMGGQAEEDEGEWDGRRPRGEAGGDPDWGPPPQGGSWDEPQQASPQGGASPGWAQATSASVGDGGWSTPQAQSGGSQPSPWESQGGGSPFGGGGGGGGNQTPAPAADGWGATAPPSNVGWGAPGADAGGWGSPAGQGGPGAEDSAPGAGGGWNTPQTGQKSESNDAWSQGSGDAMSPWGTPQAPNPAGEAGSAWGGAQPVAQAPQNQDLGQAPGQPAGQAPGPVPGLDSGWGTPQAAGPQGGQNTWGQPPAAPVEESWSSTPGQGSSPWGGFESEGNTPGAGSNQAFQGGAPAWGESASAGSPSWGDASAPGSLPQAPGAQSEWGNPQAPQSSNNQQAQEPGGWGGASSGPSMGWGAPGAQGAPSAPEQSGQAPDSWGSSPTPSLDGWGAAASQDSGWGEPSTSSSPPQTPPQQESQPSAPPWGTPGGSPAQPQGAAQENAPPEQLASGTNWSVPGADTGPGSSWGAPSAPGSVGTGSEAGKPAQGQSSESFASRGGNWSLEAEQMETGTWQAYAPSTPDSSLGANPAAMSGQPPSAERWGQPVNPGAMPVPPAPPAPPVAEMGGDEVQSHWDLPIQEKLKDPNAPIEPATPSAPGFGSAGFGESQVSQGSQGVPGAPGSIGGLGSPSTLGGPQMPAAAAQDTSSGLFGQKIDDSAMDKIFSENLGIGQQPEAPNAPAEPQGPAQPEMPASTPPQFTPVASQTDQAPPASWGAPPSPSFPTVSTEMSFAPPELQQAQQAQQDQSGQAPRFTPVQAKADAPQQAAPSPFQAPGAPQPTPSPFQAPGAQQAPQVPVPNPAEDSGGLFNKLDDTEMDQIFANLGVQESSIPVGQQQGQPPQPENGQVPQPQSPFSSPQTPPGMGQAPGSTPPMGGFGAPPMAPGQMQPGGAGFGAMEAPPGFGNGQSPVGQGAPPAIPEPQASSQSQGLLQVNDDEMDALFNNVLANPGSEQFGSNQINTGQVGGQQPQAPPPQPQMAAPPQFGGAPMPPQMPQPPQMPPQQQPLPAMASVPASGPPPKIEGIGKLDASYDTNETGSGRIAAIGKFLLDQNDIEKLGKITEADQQDVKMRILTLEASADLQGLLTEISGQPGVIGSVIVGHDGLLIANTMPDEVDAESIGVWSLGVYMNTEHVTKKMGHKRVHQVVSRTPRGYVVIADFGGGLLVCITDGTETNLLIPLMRKITDLVS